LRKVVFLDSGFGGLSVLLASLRLRTDLECWYFSDQKNLPYGAKSADWLQDRAIQMVRMIQEYVEPELIVVACNTLSVCALSSLRSAFEVPFVGVVPAVKPAASRADVQKIAVLSTTFTAESAYLQNLVVEHGGEKDIKIFPSEGLVHLAEHFVAGRALNDFSSEFMEKVHDLLISVRNFDPDSVVLGCTHFSFLKEFLSDFFGEKVMLIDSADAVARQVSRLLPARTPVKQPAPVKVCLNSHSFDVRIFIVGFY